MMSRNIRNGSIAAIAAGLLLVVNSAVVAFPGWDDDFVRVQIHGTLETGIMAIGGETTGTIIKSGNITWELDLSKNREAQAAAERLSGKKVFVSGRLELKKGVEIRGRWIVHVDKFSTRNIFAADGKQNPMLNENGTFKKPLVVRVAQGGFAGFSGHLYTIEKDGRWKREPFLNENVRAADASGKLDAKQCKQIAELMSAKKIFSLPPNFGMRVGANPVQISVQFGEFKTQVTLQPGTQSASEIAAKFEKEKRLMETVDTIRNLLK